MKILERYIIGRYIRTFCFILIILTLIILLIDFTERNAHFARDGVNYRDILHYYYAHSLYMVSFILPIVVFITTVFITASLSQHMEIVAMLSSGMSFNKIIRPYLLVAVVIALGNFWLTGWGLAKSNKVRIAFESKHPIEIENPVKHLHLRISPTMYCYAAKYNLDSLSVSNVSIELIEDCKLKERTIAYRMSWLPKTQEWKIQDWTTRKIEGIREIITHGSQKTLNLDLHPNDFVPNVHLHEILTLPKLNEQIQRLKRRGSDYVRLFLVDKYVRYMAPFSVLILTLLGVVVVARRTRKGFAAQLALGFILALIYIAGLLLVRGFAENRGIHLLFTIWLPNLVFTSIGGIMYRRLYK